MIAIGGGNGAAVITSQYLGAKQFNRMRTSISTALLTLLAVSLPLGSFGFMILDILSVTVMGMGVDGVAIATVAAQGI